MPGLSDKVNKIKDILHTNGYISISMGSKPLVLFYKSSTSSVFFVHHDISEDDLRETLVKINIGVTEPYLFYRFNYK